MNKKQWKKNPETHKAKAIAAGLVMVFLLVFSVIGQEKSVEKVSHEFVGAKKCKTCHKSQYTSWLDTKHAKAYDKLSDEEKKKPSASSAISPEQLPRIFFLKAFNARPVMGLEVTTNR